jgi:hypothetical protein
MKHAQNAQLVRPVTAGLITFAASGALALAPAASAVAVARDTLGAPAHRTIGDSGVDACAALALVHQVRATQYPSIRADFAHSRWGNLRTAGTAYVDLATALLRATHAYGGETVWFYERLSATCAAHGRPLNDNA